jgi:outer membrane immunogenic protein
MKLRETLFGLTLTSALALAAVSANAADIYVPGPGGYKDPVWVPEWAGFYIGANGGYLQTTANPNVSLPPSGGFDGEFIGGQIGYNIQRGAFVFGVEADIEGAANSVAHSYLIPLYGVNDYGSVVGRVGYSFGRALVYGRGGLAWGDTKLAGLDFTSTGYTVGGGIAWKVGPRWSVFGEYDYVDLGKESVPGFRDGPGFTEKYDFNVFKLGVNWHVGGWDYEPLK